MPIQHHHKQGNSLQVERLNNAKNSTLAGFDDWRLPTVKELQSIVDYSGAFPAIDSRFKCNPIKTGMAIFQNPKHRRATDLLENSLHKFEQLQQPSPRRLFWAL